MQAHMDQIEGSPANRLRFKATNTWPGVQTSNTFAEIFLFPGSAGPDFSLNSRIFVPFSPPKKSIEIRLFLAIHRYCPTE
jgi:hypothetical protein